MTTTDEGCGRLCMCCGRRYRVSLTVPDPIWASIRMPSTPPGQDQMCGSCVMLRLEEQVTNRNEFGAVALRLLTPLLRS